MTIRGRSRGFGTGFLVSPQLLLTNNHVLKTAEAAAASFVEFDYQEGTDGAPLPVTKVGLDPAAFFVTDRALDFTMVAVRPGADARARMMALGYLPMTGGDDGYVIGENVTIIQHPNGKAKQVALRDNQVIGESAAKYLHYRTGTMPGSSGSPVFNDDFELVALHHSGVPARDPETRQILTVDGQPWRSRMGEDRVKWVANEGVLVPAILAFLDGQRLQGRAADLLAELKDAARTERPRRGLQEAAPAASPVPAFPLPGPSYPAPVPQDGGTIVTIPLRLTIRLDVGSTEANPITFPAPSAVLPPPAPDGGRTAVPTAALPKDRDREAALAEVEAARGRPYFDPGADALDRETYYRGLAPGDDPAEAYRRVSRRLKETHATQLPYQPSLHLYPWVDLQPNGKIRSVYSGKEFDPVELIEQDFAVEAERTARLQELFAREATVTPDDVASELDLLEAELPYNCEHVVPQSWFAKKQPMRGDLHHLFSCESGCNSFRGNTPYYDFPDFEEAVREECGKREGEKFEPGAGKGAVARATLYYPGTEEAHTNPTRQRGECLRALAGASG